MRAGFLILAACTLVWTGAARADEVSTARKLYQSGTKHFDLGEYEDALKDFKEAYRSKDDPVLLYNIAQCQRLLKRNEEALRSYKIFLTRVTDEHIRRDVEQKIAALQEAIDKQNRAATLPPHQVIDPNATPPSEPATTALTKAPPPPAKKPLYKQWWLWTAVGAVVVVGVGVGLGVGLTRGSDTRFFPSVSY